MGVGPATRPSPLTLAPCWVSVRRENLAEQRHTRRCQPVAETRRGGLPALRQHVLATGAVGGAEDVRGARRNPLRLRERPAPGRLVVGDEGTDLFERRDVRVGGAPVEGEV